MDLQKHTQRLLKKSCNDVEGNIFFNKKIRSWWFFPFWRWGWGLVCFLKIPITVLKHKIQLLIGKVYAILVMGVVFDKMPIFKWNF